MGNLKILKVEYAGDRFFFESPSLDSRLCIIEGPNGAGKSTLFNLIYYGLGGRVEEFERDASEAHKEITGDSNNFVRLVVKLRGQAYTFTRKIGDNLVTVFKAGVETDGVISELVSLTLPIHRREEHETFSDWLLTQLDIPVVDIFQGGKNFKLNFADLARLIYHNQSPDPLGIYKPADSVNFITDSLEIRRAIFQILVGKSQLELYRSIGKMKLADREAQAARTVHQEYVDIVTQLLKESGFTQVQNTKSLGAQIEALESQIDRIRKSRWALSHGKLGEIAARQMLQAEVWQLQELEAARRKIDDQRNEIAEEAGRLVDVERSLKADIERINKVIYTHGQLNLFSSDTCPFCLNSVQREEHRCVCGNVVDEHDYQRFFYSPTEYLDILRSKSKSLETLRVAAEGIKEESAHLISERALLETKLAERRQRAEGAIGESGSSSVAVEELDDKLLETREKLAKAQEALRLETKLAQLQERWSQQKALYDAAKADVLRLDALSKTELQTQIIAFNKVFNEFMTTVLAGCRVATIDAETYLPIINNGEYREASAKVPKRFLYYLTLLQLSLLSAIPFPRLLLIDTPETAGIDRENLDLMVGQIGELRNPNNQDFQVLLSTGTGKYPEKFRGNVVLTLTRASQLLQARPVAT
ncbi:MULTISPECIES: ATP-binding protein [unclassified Thiomonas]|uniref:ATP-binding protein n=1 Tax=unclassified Thiomonas TaxID=2625466 RepID=UPI0004DB9D1B|nr:MULTISPECIES: ATP-binding protein [unclassified Thiomonas]CDW93428.1 conserved hypothetical protein [Thiomonas sp. CB2]VDY05164.1 conserved protein of unknown function [Thiomonas sp. Bio17B3]VDY07671.1 conserved protein of unknown function [Thiomonas sp. Sup16B3]VDY13410.1 conserved protein of unknown function [Thiomonas sp. OC7]VDY17382.1 conserved protein of unknown function [Thiomonas sp. CB2]